MNLPKVLFLKPINIFFDLLHGYLNKLLDNFFLTSLKYSFALRLH